MTKNPNVFSWVIKFIAGFLSKVEQDKKKINSVIILSLIIAAFDFVFLISLQMKGVRSAAPKISKLKKDIEDVNKDLSFFKKLEEQRKKTDSKESVKVKTVISEEQFPSFFQEISAMANAYDIKILQMKPLKEIKAKAESKKGDSKKKEEKNLLPVFISMELSCGYHSLGKFINDLENAKQFVSIQNMTVNRDSDDYLSQNVLLTLKAYVKK